MVLLNPYDASYDWVQMYCVLGHETGPKTLDVVTYIMNGCTIRTLLRLIYCGVLHGTYLFESSKINDPKACA